MTDWSPTAGRLRTLLVWVGLPLAAVGLILVLSLSTSSAAADLCEQVQVGEVFTEVQERIEREGWVVVDYASTGAGKGWKSFAKGVGGGKRSEFPTASCVIHYDAHTRKVTHTELAGRR